MKRLLIIITLIISGLDLIAQTAPIKNDTVRTKKQILIEQEKKRIRQLRILRFKNHVLKATCVTVLYMTVKNVE